MKFIKQNKFTSKQIAWNEARRSAPNIPAESNGFANLPMTKMEAETFQDMIARGVTETMDVASIYKVEK